MNDAILSVSQVGAYIKQWMDGDGVLSRILVRGEISNYRLYPSGHHYFTLKDAEGVLRCVMFRGDAGSLKFRPEDGMKVVAAGRVTVFVRDGQYQLYCTSLQPEGIGALTIAYEQLKAKLLSEGLFDEAHKKKLPQFPRRVALVTSPAGAAVRDMIRIFGRRWPLCKILVVPVRVQGEEAPGEICAALAYVNLHNLADVIITGRGGGSIEDLWAFNEEAVARAIFASAIPVVSAVGHEPDVTIADFVADVRAATPSHAAELVAPDQLEWTSYLKKADARLSGGMQNTLRLRRELLKRATARRVLQSPMAFIQDKRMALDLMGRKLAAAATRTLKKHREASIRLVSKLDAMSPLKVLARGYSIVTGPQGAAVKDAGELKPGDVVRVRLSRGAAVCTVDETIE